MNYTNFLEKTYKDRNEQYHKNIIVNKLISDYGYEPTNENDYVQNHSYKIKTNFDKVLRADEKITGKLLIIECMKDLRLYNMSSGEGDLNDLQYHKIDFFRKVEQNGYDGIVIDDFAQSNIEGNFGHLSYGFLQKTIDDKLIILKDSIDAVHPDGYSFGDRKSIEYKKYLLNK